MSRHQPTKSIQHDRKFNIYIGGVLIDRIAVKNENDKSTFTTFPVSQANLEETKFADNEKRYCDPCGHDEVTIIASAFCVDCLEYLCKACCKDHSRIKLTRQHRVLKDKDFPTDTTALRHMKELLNCPKHLDKAVSFKCLKHSSLICLLCLATEHKTCETVEVENDILLKDKREMDLLGEKASSLIDSVTSKGKKNLSALCTKESIIRKEIESAKDRFHQQIDFIANELHGEVSALVSKEKKSIELGVLKCETFKTETEKHKNLFKTATEFGSTKEKCLASRHVFENISRITSEVERISIEPAHIEYTPALDPLGSKTLGSVYVDGEITNLPTYEQANASSDEFSESLMSKHNLEERKEIDPNITNETRESNSLEPLMGRCMPPVREERVGIDSEREPCCISRIETLTDGRILLTDYENKNVKMFDHNFSYISQKNLGGKPVDFCLIKSEEMSETHDHFHLGVCYNRTRRIDILCITPSSITHCSSFTTERYVRSMTVHGDLLCLLCCDEVWNERTDNTWSSLQLCNKEGEILNEFLDLNIPDPIRVRVFGDILVIAEQTKVTAYEAEDLLFQCCLQRKWFYKGPGDSVDGILDVDSDNEGCMYVACASSRNLHQVWMNNFWINRILLEDINVRSVHFDSTRNRLMVYPNHSDYIRIYEI